MGTGTDADAVYPDGGTRKAGVDATGSYMLMGAGSEIAGWNGAGPGKVYLGEPPDGHFVKRDQVGLAYKSPGG